MNPQCGRIRKRHKRSTWSALPDTWRIFRFGNVWCQEKRGWFSTRRPHGRGAGTHLQGRGKRRWKKYHISYCVSHQKGITWNSLNISQWLMENFTVVREAFLYFGSGSQKSHIFSRYNQTVFPRLEVSHMHTCSWSVVLCIVRWKQD